MDNKYLIIVNTKRYIIQKITTIFFILFIIKILKYFFINDSITIEAIYFHIQFNLYF